MSVTGQPVDPVVATFKQRDEVRSRRPDHDPHGEDQALAAHSTSSCDSCGKTGLVPTGVLEFADGFTGEPERDVICQDCGNQGGNR